MKYYFEDLLIYFKENWYNTKNDNNLYKKDISGLKHSKLRKIRKNILNLLNNFNPKNPHDKNFKAGLFGNFKEFLIIVFEVDESVCNKIISEETYLMTVELIKRAKETNPELKADSINKALKNVWIYIIMCLHFGKDLILEDYLFAYSMLYPLTDNYLDDDTISNEEKMDFNSRFYDKIKYNKSVIKNDKEKEIFLMIDLIARNYSRDKYPHLYLSLLGILDAQKKSIRQQKLKNVFDIDLIDYTFYKGGMAILTDAYFVKGEEISEEDKRFAYGLGCILQLIDDFNDVREDAKNNIITMMNVQTKVNNIDEMYFKMNNFISLLLNEVYQINVPERKYLKDAIYIVLEIIFLGAFYRNKRYFSGRAKKIISKNSYFTEFEYKNTIYLLIKKLIYIIDGF